MQAGTPFVTDSSLIVTNNTFQSQDLTYPILGSNETKTLIIKPQSQLKVDLNNVKFDDERGVMLQEDNYINLEYKVGKQKRLAFVRITYDKNRGDLSLVVFDFEKKDSGELDSLPGEDEVKAELDGNVDIYKPFKIELILEPGQKDRPGQNYEWKIHNYTTIQQERITRGLVPELTKQSEVEKLLLYKRK